MDSAVVGSVVRHLITTVGGALLAKGVLDAGQLEIIAGSLAAIAGVAWGIWQKKKA
jgi:uncharacterized membrane protein SpoIIM required for sporulation